MTPAHEVTFRGLVEFGPPAPPAGAFVLAAGAELLEGASVQALRAAAARCLVIAGRPDRHTVEGLAGAAAETGAGVIVAVGAGVVLDAAKAAAVASGHELVLVPAGAEPWRAATAFATVDGGDGTRTSTPDPRLGGACVVVDADLWRRVPAGAQALHRLDSTVHAVESLLSRRAQPYSEALAAAALRALSGPEQPVPGVVGALLAAEAFGATRLGIAHALASPLGAALGTSHDALNCILGCTLPGFWADAAAWPAIGSALGTEPSAGAVAAVLAGMRERAGLPGTLREAGVSWAAVESALDRAARSSGMPWLPRPVSAEELAAFARRAWQGGA